MTKRPPPASSRQASSNSEQQQSPLTHQGLSPQKQQEQAIMLEPFYEQLIGMAFNQSTIAIERCRDLCAEFGFTVKQEASTHRNIYVYCSREGLPDSLRNPKSNPQRKRPSKRCDCRWRVVLYENEDHWEFRKSLNPEAGKHNHELMRPEEIERSWPKEVTALICELARLRMTTQEIRNRVRGQFPNIHWNERRFYNRLSEERQKIKLRDSAERTQQLNQLWSKVCMATAGNDDLSEFVKQEMTLLFQSICETVQIDSSTFPLPLILKDDDVSGSGRNNNEHNEEDAASTPASATNEYDTIHNAAASSSSFMTVADNNSSKKSSIAPKGYLPVEIPKQVYYIKIHNQRQLHETQLLKNQRTKISRPLIDQPESLEPFRKISGKGKARQSSCSMLVSTSTAEDQHSAADTTMQQLSPLIPQPSFTTNRNQTQQARQQQQQQQQTSTTQFVYYENSPMPPLDSAALSNYVHHQHQSFQNPYNMSPPPSGTSNGFNTPTELTFSFNSSPGGGNGGRSGESGNGGNNSNEPTIHPALQSAPMSHQQQQQQQKNSLNPIHNQQQQRMYTTNKTSPQQQQQMRIIYESPKDNSHSNLRSLLPDNQQQYQRQQGIYNAIRSSSSHNQQQQQQPHHHHAGNNIMPMYQQQQQQPSDMNPPSQ